METSIVPNAPANSRTVYQVLDHLGRHGRVWIEIGDEDANEETIVQWIIEGQFSHPLRVIAFNTDEGWARDVTRDIAWKLFGLNRSGTDLGAAAREFVERLTGETPTVTI
jgi:hypothetical protein